MSFKLLFFKIACLKPKKSKLILCVFYFVSIYMCTDILGRSYCKYSQWNAKPKRFLQSSNGSLFQFLKRNWIYTFLLYLQAFCCWTAGYMYNHYSKFDFTEATYLLMKTMFLLLTRFLLSSFMVKSVSFPWFTSTGFPQRS